METTEQLQRLLEKGAQYLSSNTDEFLSQKPQPNKWSKKEILGHLIDSAINNLKRFTEAVYTQPYQMVNYDQDELVKVNQYQNTSIQELTILWVSLNNQIINVLNSFNEEHFNLIIILPNGSVKDMAFWMNDYAEHLEHHLKQIWN